MLRNGRSPVDPEQTMGVQRAALLAFNSMDMFADAAKRSTYGISQDAVDCL